MRKIWRMGGTMCSFCCCRNRFRRLSGRIGMCSVQSTGRRKMNGEQSYGRSSRHGIGRLQRRMEGGFGGQDITDLSVARLLILRRRITLFIDTALLIRDLEVEVCGLALIPGIRHEVPLLLLSSRMRYPLDVLAVEAVLLIAEGRRFRLGQEPRSLHLLLLALVRLLQRFILRWRERIALRVFHPWIANALAIQRAMGIRQDR